MLTTLDRLFLQWSYLGSSQKRVRRRNQITVRGSLRWKAAEKEFAQSAPVLFHFGHFDIRCPLRGSGRTAVLPLL